MKLNNYAPQPQTRINRQMRQAANTSYNGIRNISADSVRSLVRTVAADSVVYATVMNGFCRGIVLGICGARSRM